MNEVKQKIPQGYKMTEVGVIPEDWEVDNVQSVSKISTGSKNTQDRIDNGQYPFFVRSQKVERIDTYSFDGESVLTAGDGVGTGKVFHYINGKFDFHQRVYKISNFQNIDGRFFFLYFSNNFYDRIMQMTAKSSVDSVRMEMIAEMNIPIPPTIKEQKAIATVLSDMDELIEKLDKLIAKKKLIKQGAMQELLTGKKRLPGFNGEWEVKKLGEILKYEQPIKYIVDNVDYRQNAKTPVLTAGKTFILGYTEENIGIYRNLPVIIFDDFTTANKFVDFLFKVKSSAMKLLTARDANCYDLKFLHERMQVIKFLISDGDHKRRWIGEYQNIEILIPSYNEQKAIAQILSDMDSEIEKLEKKKEKYQQIKEGAMQVLLTGRVRLV